VGWLQPTGGGINTVLSVPCCHLPSSHRSLSLSLSLFLSTLPSLHPPLEVDAASIDPLLEFNSPPSPPPPILDTSMGPLPLPSWPRTTALESDVINASRLHGV
ncbi:hypothetical protein ASPFODRAFT_53000, partial [Aspergillus luchuensis CBS 106.47]